MKLFGLLLLVALIVVVVLPNTAHALALLNEWHSFAATHSVSVACRSGVAVPTSSGVGRGVFASEQLIEYVDPQTGISGSPIGYPDASPCSTVPITSPTYTPETAFFIGGNSSYGKIITTTSAVGAIFSSDQTPLPLGIAFPPSVRVTMSPGVEYLFSYAADPLKLQTQPPPQNLIVHELSAGVVTNTGICDVGFPLGLGSAAAVTPDQQIIFTTGFNGSNVPADGNWGGVLCLMPSYGGTPYASVLAIMRLPRNLTLVAVASSSQYVVFAGGIADQSVLSADIVVFAVSDFQSGNFTPVKTLQLGAPKRNLQATVVGDQFFLFYGGFSDLRFPSFATTASIDIWDSQDSSNVVVSSALLFPDSQYAVAVTSSSTFILTPVHQPGDSAIYTVYNISAVSPSSSASSITTPPSPATTTITNAPSITTTTTAVGTGTGTMPPSASSTTTATPTSAGSTPPATSTQPPPSGCGPRPDFLPPTSYCDLISLVWRSPQSISMSSSRSVANVSAVVIVDGSLDMSSAGPNFTFSVQIGPLSLSSSNGTLVPLSIRDNVTLSGVLAVHLLARSNASKPEITIIRAETISGAFDHARVTSPDDKPNCAKYSAQIKQEKSKLSVLLTENSCKHKVKPFVYAIVIGAAVIAIIAVIIAGVFVYKKRLIRRLFRSGLKDDEAINANSYQFLKST